MTVQTVTGAESLLLGGDPSSVALTAAGGTTTYAELAAAVAAQAERLGPERRLALVEMRNDLTSVVRLLGALEARHPVVLLGPDEGHRHDEIRQRYEGAHDLHPDLALLMSTSGSTGSPKLVRLSHDNLVANAGSIAAYLALTSEDRAITSLPLHYCYGLSVLTSHLSVGGSVALTDLSVADDCFWDLATRSRATSFAGVPYTFDLLESSGFADRDLPDLRYVTPGRRADGSRPGAPVRCARTCARFRPVRHVRTDRGHGPDGLSAAGSRVRAPGRHRCPRPRRGTSGSSPSRTTRVRESGSSSTRVRT